MAHSLTYLQKHGQHRVSVGYMAVALTLDIDDRAQSGEGSVDILGLFERLADGACFANPLRPYRGVE